MSSTNYNKTIVKKDGTIVHLLNGKQHRTDGPAVIYPNGIKVWKSHGVTHRLDGPAREYLHGTYHWVKRGKLHRNDGPAIYGPNSLMSAWFINGLVHREDGPAIIFDERYVQAKRNMISLTNDIPMFDPDINSINPLYKFCLKGVDMNFDKWCIMTNKIAEEISYIRLKYNI